MAKIRYNSDGTHTFVGLPHVPFDYLKWCPHCRSFSGCIYRRTRYVGSRRIMRFECPECGLYEVAITAEQRVVRHAPSENLRLPVSPLPVPSWSKPSDTSTRQVFLMSSGVRLTAWNRDADLLKARGLELLVE